MKYLRLLSIAGTSVPLGIASLCFGQTTQASGEDRAIEFMAPWPPWVTILLLLLSAAIVYGIYSRETAITAAWKKWGMATLRFALICIVVWMM